MNREYDYSGLIEGYITGRLSEKQKLEFEAQLEVNPDLNKDFMLQKDIITSIKDARKAELKSMLNNVNVSSGNGINYFPLQIIGAVLVTSLLAVGTYYYFTENDQSERSTVSVETTTPPNGSSQQYILPATTDEDRSASEETIILPQENIITEETSTPNAEISPSESSTGQETTIENPSDKVISTAPEEPAKIENTEGQAGSSGLNVETKKDRNHAFHYQYYEDKLFLYGDFKGNAYEILKLPTPSGTKMYMSYDGRFYKMERSRKIKGFEPVEDPAIIEQLQKIKTK
jgi:hypothetical protein